MKRLAKNEVISGVVDFIKDTNDVSIAREVVNELNNSDASNTPDKAVVTSSVTLPESEKVKIEKKLRSEYGEEIDVSYNEDKSLLGGFIIKVGDFVYDNSISGQIENIKQTLYGQV